MVLQQKITNVKAMIFTEGDNISTKLRHSQQHLCSIRQMVQQQQTQFLSDLLAAVQQTKTKKQ